MRRCFLLERTKGGCSLSLFSKSEGTVVKRLSILDVAHLLLLAMAKRCLFWEDKCCSGVSLANIFPRPHNLAVNKKISVFLSGVRCDNSWQEEIYLGGGLMMSIRI